MESTTRPSFSGIRGLRPQPSVLTKLLTMGVLTLGLLIPLAMVSSMVREREGRQLEAEQEVTRSWGQAQTLVGPFLSVPYTRVASSVGMITTEEGEAVLLPSALEAKVELIPEIRQLGIFQVVLYRARVRLEGRFDQPGTDLVAQATHPLSWDEASLVLGVPDLRGLQNDLEISWDGKELPLEPGTSGSQLVACGLHLPLKDIAPSGEEGAEPERAKEFHLELMLNGSRELRIAPVGRTSVITVSSAWPDPSFVGSYLPTERQVTEEGFTARWEVSFLSRGYPEGWNSHRVPDGERRLAVLGSAVGVELRDLVTGYRKTERSTKYAVLFIVVTFGTFFLFEVFRPAVLHSMHYLLVGFALCIFYLLLLSISEFLPFGGAYGISTAAVVVLITGYSRSILGDGRRGLFIGGVLAGLYGYLYVLLQLRDLALLLGTVGLFVILAAFMYLTRNVDWHELRIGRQGGPEPAESTSAMG
ncbi:MAG: cell envelope integrity protein CreD [Acidobacteria bacterium]|nr:cell envelope integrity protein CreD [Acidobacteriota bacterium]